MITAELARKINLLPQESYNKVENFVEQLLTIHAPEKVHPLQIGFPNI